MYAPSLRYHNGTFYMITTVMPLLPPDAINSTPRSFFVTTTDIFDENKWSEATYIDQPGIDPDLFFDDDGRIYATVAFNSSIYIGEVDIKTGNSLSSWEQTLTSTAPCPLAQLAEGPHIYTINGTYYLLTAEVGTEALHQSRIYRSQNVRGPWEASPTNPLLFNGADLSRGLLSTGHADMVEGTDGKWWAVFLAARFYNPRNYTGYRQLGRETFLTPVEWREDGWPTFNKGQPITENMEGYLYDLPRPRIWRDDFNNGTLADKNYYRIRTPFKDTVDLQSRPGFARLHGSPYTISNRASPSALLRKQQDINVTFSTELNDFNPSTPLLQEAGASIFLNDYFHNDIGVTISNITNSKAIVVRISTGVVPVDLSALAGLVSTSGKCNTTVSSTPTSTTMAYSQNVTLIEDPAVASGAPVRFVIEAKENGYRLGYTTTQHDVAPIWVGEVSNQWLDASPLTNFEGSNFALYNSGGGESSSAVADFGFLQTEVN
jgi:beta-xylosidase